ncbi:MAG: hypothetical protein QHH13_09560 [Melioribacter sp.]|uniref:hypothetical protein n=1 Tax=Rosettibacter primus TaxID=3111523 RepID=UPI00247DC333|nr:hypothetical protein [Melioribacter sp.]
MDKNSKEIFFTVLCGFLSCMIFGMVFYGLNIFHLHDTRFQIVLLGLFGSLIYAVMNYRNKKELIYVAILFLITTAIVRAKSVSLHTLLMDFILIVAVFLSIYYYKLFIDKNNNIPLFLRALVLMLLFGLTNVLGVIILMIIHNVEISATYLLFYSRVPALIGLALGIGFDIYEKYKEKLLVV